MKKKILILAISVITLLSVACTKNTEETPKAQTKQLVYCSECGKEATEVTKFCPNCGEETKWSSEKVKTNSNKKSDKKEEESKTTSNTQETVTTINCREEYINKLNQVEESMADLEDLYAGSTIEMKDASSQCLERWDQMLNEIYGLLKEQLSPSVADYMKKKQVEWIKYRDKTAETSASEYAGGTMEGLIYLESLGQTTKARCYELVNTYMD